MSITAKLLYVLAKHITLSIDVNIGLGLSIFTSTYSKFSDSNAPVWLYVSYIVAMVLIFVVAIPLIKQCNKGWKKWREEDRNGEDITLSVGNEIILERKYSRKTSPERLKKLFMENATEWIALVIFLGLTLAVVLVLIVLILIAI